MGHLIDGSWERRTVALSVKTAGWAKICRVRKHRVGSKWKQALCSGEGYHSPRPSATSSPSGLEDVREVLCAELVFPGGTIPAILTTRYLSSLFSSQHRWTRALLLEENRLTCLPGPRRPEMVPTLAAPDRTSYPCPASSDLDVERIPEDEAKSNTTAVVSALLRYERILQVGLGSPVQQMRRYGSSKTTTILLGHRLRVNGTMQALRLWTYDLERPSGQDC